MTALHKVGTVLQALRQVCRKACSRLCEPCRCCGTISPVVVILTLSAVLLLASLVLVFNICMAKLVTVPGALLVNLGLLWLLLRLIVRILVFPGSLVCWRRNTEATYRVEMAKQFTHHIEHLQLFLEAAARNAHTGYSSSLEGALLGCMVVEGLARNFRMQQRDQVTFTKEQARLRLLVQSVETWLSEAKVLERRGDLEMQVSLIDWLTRMSQRLTPVPVSYAVANAPLAADAKAGAELCLERLQQLLEIFDDLQKNQDSCWANTRRFMRVPTVGSLHQLRAELLVRYSGHHYWVRTPGGRKLDAMFISCRAGEGVGEDGAPSEPSGSAREDVPLKEVAASSESGARGPVIVWCNPNAAYYETMAYESHWLDFYLSQGCSVMVFNYSGFGRSEGTPSPDALAADGNAVVDFLRRRGFENVGVHGRSIGGIAACSLAAANPDVVKLLVADRTFSTLSKVASCTFGNWARHGLSLSATWADNTSGYLQARCYKVMLCDPRDATIPDLSSLRTAVALEAVGRAEPHDRIILDEGKAARIAEAWTFLEAIVGVCDRECGGDSGQAKRPARQPVVGKPSVSEADGFAGEEDMQRLVAGRSGGKEAKGVKKLPLTAQWLDENSSIVWAVMSTQLGNLRSLLDVVGMQFNAGGMTLDDAIGGGRSAEEAAAGLHSFLANLQVWGSLGTVRERRNPASDRDVELLLAKGSMQQEAPELATRLGRVASQLTPDRLSTYYRQLSRTTLAHVRREFRQYAATVRRAFESPRPRDELPGGAELRTAALGHLREVEGLLTSIYRFFKCIDVVGGQSLSAASSPSPSPHAVDPSLSDDCETEDMRTSEDGALGSAQPRPAFDRSVTGYVVTLDCGHNGVLSEGETQHLALHVKAARFGKWADLEGGEGPTFGGGRQGKELGWQSSGPGAFL